jgi:hypothetical protein
LFTVLSLRFYFNVILQLVEYLNISNYDLKKYL